LQNYAVLVGGGGGGGGEALKPQWTMSLKKRKKEKTKNQ